MASSSIGVKRSSLFKDLFNCWSAAADASRKARMNFYTVMAKPFYLNCFTTKFLAKGLLEIVVCSKPEQFEIKNDINFDEAK